MKEIKKVLFTFAAYDYTGIEKYLEKQASEGWMLKRFTGVFMEFSKVEPKKLRFSVTYFSKATGFEPKPSKEQEHYMDLCEYTGWKFVTSCDQMQIFCTEDEYATPLETDPIMKVNNIHKSIKKIFILPYIVLLAVVLINVLMAFSGLFFDTIEVLANNFVVLSGICNTVALLLIIVEFIAYFKWKKKALKSAEDGIFVESSGKTNFQYLVNVIVCVGAVFMIGQIGGIIPLCLGIGIAIGAWAIVIGRIYLIGLFKRLGLSKNANRILSTLVFAIIIIVMFVAEGIVLFKVGISMRSQPAYTYKYEDTTYEVYHDEIPFRIEDFMDARNDEYSTRCTTKSSIFIEYIEASQDTRYDVELDEGIEYTIVKVKAPFVYDMVKNSMYKEIEEYCEELADWRKIVKVDENQWNANEVYEVYGGEWSRNHYLIMFDEVIVEIQFSLDLELTDEQKSIIGEKLKNLK